MQLPRPSHFVFACACVLALCGLLASGAAARPASQTSPGDPLDPRTYAPESKLFLTVHAIGVQKYTCDATGAWVFTDPLAALFKTGQPRNWVGTHFLNFATGRPVWQYEDGSSVEAARKVSVPAAPGNIPWLLLEKMATTSGSEGDRLTPTTWVQRLNTSGGVAPAGSCVTGKTAAVRYGADYFFWKAKASSSDESDG